MGTVFDIRRGSVKDGPGWRTCVFLKGCPLRCIWCHNPESQRMEAERMRRGGTDDEWEAVGRDMSIEAVMAEVTPDIPFYASSGGGLTLTGGEPLAQPAFALEVASAAKSAGIHVALDTCGHAPWTTLEPFLPVVDLFLYDFKCADPARHRELTGVGNGLILANLRALGDAGARLWLRCPLVPGLNDRDADLDAIADWAERLDGVESVTLEPYHPIGLDKYARLGRTPPFDRREEAGKLDVARWRARIESRTTKKVMA